MKNKTNLSDALIISLFLKYFQSLSIAPVKNWKVSGAALPKIRYICFDIFPFFFSVMFSFSPYLFSFFHNLWTNLKGAYNISILSESSTNCTDISLQ